MPFTWSDGVGRTVVAVEPVSEGPAPGAWCEHAGALAVIRGQVRWCGQPWQRPQEWAGEVLRRWPSRPYGYPLEGTVGDATAVCVDGEGRGIVTADHFGGASAYFHLGADVLIASSRPSLVAHVLDLMGRPTRPDLLGLAWLARAEYQVGRSTSYEDVSRLPVGATIALTARGGATVVERAVPWADGWGMGSLTSEEVCDVVEEAVADQLRAAAGLGRRVVLDVTGGRDSRLVLSVALSVLDPESFILRTIGPPGARDVQIASQMAEQLGLEHQTGFPRPRAPGSFRDHAEEFLDRTDGSLSTWIASVPHPFDPEVRISGTSGEIYRVGPIEAPTVDAGPSRWSLSPREAADAVEASYRRGLTDDLLLPGCARSLRGRLDDHFDHLDRIGTPGDQLLYRYYADFQNRTVTGELLELEADHRVLALVDLRGVRALASQPQSARYQEVVHQGLIRRLAPQLLDLPLANDRWRAGPTGSAAHLVGPAPAPSSRAETPAGRPGPVGAAPGGRGSEAPPPVWSVMADAKARPNQVRREYVTDALTSAPEEFWEMFDRERIRTRLDGFDELSMRPRKQVYAAATAARWLSRIQG